jgi:hypothetical protein
MQKKKPYGYTLKEQLRAGAGDRLYNFLLAEGAIRGLIINGIRMVNEMRVNTSDELYRLLTSPPPTSSGRCSCPAPLLTN